MLTLFLVLIYLFCIGAISSLFLWKNKSLSNLVSNSFAIVGSVIGVVLSISILLTHVVTQITVTTSMPLFTVSLRIDSLAAYFILIISIVSLACSVFAIDYMRQYFDKYNIGVFGFFYNVFLLSLFLVVTASNGFYFLFVWEIMSLSSLFLVIFEHNHFENIKAGIIYFVMTHIGTLFIFAAFILLYMTTKSFDFWVIKSLSSSIPSTVKDWIFVLMLLGFGTKAGMIPLHIWLPKAHSAAPSQVSSLMSGVMVKMGIFMFFRFFLDILPQGPFWWGAIIILLGGISSLLGVLYALSEHDSKRLLAYHTIENIGIILLGIGGSMIFLQLHLPILAMLAASAALFHTFNHAIFKSLLFLGAGSVIGATHTRNLESYGGLIKLMPYTAFFFLIGAIAISGLPPFNGFASEWVTFQSIFAGINASTSIAVRSLFIFAGGSLALTGGLAAACFVKAFGITFLARPRSKESKHAKESSFWMLVPMGFLAALCLVLGFAAESVLTILRQILIQMGSFGKLLPVSNGFTISVQNGFAQLNMPVVLLSVVSIICVVYLLVAWVSRQEKAIQNITWDCGYIGLEPTNEITATAFSRSLILIFKGLFQPTQQHQVEYVDANIRYFTKSRAVNLVTENVYEKYFYDPLQIFTTYFSKKVKSIQGGNLNQYVLYVFVIVLGLILWVRYF